jgi:hypothetical protein
MTANSTTATSSADTISSYYERTKVQLKAERDSLIQKIKDDISSAKRKTLSKA